MDKYPKRFMILLIDFDGDANRRAEAEALIPQRLRERVFVLGAWTEPEMLKSALGSYETIGRAIARGCREYTETAWDHELLQHNRPELDRLYRSIRPILFPLVERKAWPV